jgi:hypothetical protein
VSDLPTGNHVSQHLEFVAFTKTFLLITITRLISPKAQSN